MPAASSAELGGGGRWHQTFILLTSFVTVDGHCNLRGLQFAQLKNRIGNCEMGVKEGVTEEGAGGRNKMMVVLCLPPLLSNLFFRQNLRET